MINHFEPHTTCSTKSISSEHVGLQGRRLRVDSPLLNLRWGTALAYVLQYFGNTYIIINVHVLLSYIFVIAFQANYVPALT